MNGCEIASMTPWQKLLTEAAQSRLETRRDRARLGARMIIPTLRVQNGKVFASSVDVAKAFEKRHDHVMAAIRQLIKREPSLANGSSREFRGCFDNDRGKVMSRFDMS
jgi:hypothetical protein